MVEIRGSDLYVKFKPPCEYRILHNRRGYIAQKKVTRKVWKPSVKWWPAKVFFGKFEKQHEWVVMDMFGREWWWTGREPMPPEAIFRTQPEAETFIANLRLPDRIIEV